MKYAITAATLVAALIISSAGFAFERAALQQELQQMIDQHVNGRVQADVEDSGAVRLSGYVQQKNDIDTLVARIRKVDGVTDVSSTVTDSD